MFYTCLELWPRLYEMTVPMAISLDERWVIMVRQQHARLRKLRYRDCCAETRYGEVTLAQIIILVVGNCGVRQKGLYAQPCESRNVISKLCWRRETTIPSSLTLVSSFVAIPPPWRPSAADRGATSRHSANVDVAAATASDGGSGGCDGASRGSQTLPAPPTTKRSKQSGSTKVSIYHVPAGSLAETRAKSTGSTPN